MFFVIVLLMLLQDSSCFEKGSYVGCYKHDSNRMQITGLFNLDQCLEACLTRNYRYAFSNNQTSECGCENVLEKNSVRGCEDECNSCGVYHTGNFAPTRPKNLNVLNVTDTSAYISWEAPDYYTDIQNYKIQAKVITTYAAYIYSPTWTSSNDTYSSDLSGLHPGTEYNITVQPISSLSEGDVASVTVKTKIGDPDNIPLPPETIKRKGSTMVITLNPVINNNGPVSSYYVVVLNKDNNQFFQPERLKSFKESKENDLGYYIAAEIDPNKTLDNFTVGDGRYYGRFYNAPLDPNTNYFIIEGVVSKSGGITKVVFSNASIPENIRFQEEKSLVVTGLSVAIALLSCVLIGGIIFLFYLKKTASTNRRRRLNDNQELAIHGPILEVVNAGYIPEEEIPPVNHYSNLKQKVCRIPQYALKIDYSNVLGVGKFGSVNSATLKKEDNIISATVFVIYDKKLDSQNKRNMLRDLDLLIKSEKHKNVIELLGLCETVDTLYVVLESTSTNLKNLLLGSRDTASGRFSSITESQAITFMIDIADGMKHLQMQKIIHKQLCARNIQVTDNYVVKISGYGLAQYSHPNMVPDYTRWMAVEIFNNCSHTYKSSVWSFACVVWEICVLGGTPYGSIPNNEIPARIRNGLRLVQLKYISDELYQLMLDCWQMDPNERPSFSDIIDILLNIHDGSSSFLNFSLYPGFQYEQFYIDSELVAKTVF